MPLAKKMGVPILPVDSEHSAIFQSLQGEQRESALTKILLTASGGPFRGEKAEDLAHISGGGCVEASELDDGTARSPSILLRLVNKGLEVMEAKWLFDVELEQIEVVVHPQSVIHSAVQYEDGAVIAQLGTPDMRLPIQYALYYPKRRHLSGEQTGSVCTWDSLRLRDRTRRRSAVLPLAYQAMPAAGGNIPTAFNAANEKAVALFLDQKNCLSADPGDD